MKIKYKIMNGAYLISKERKRQIEEEGFDAKHDSMNVNNQLIQAAMCYLNPKDDFVKENWPKSCEKEWFKPTIRIRDLVKAGALISAEIDRLFCKNLGQWEVDAEKCNNYKTD